MSPTIVYEADSGLSRYIAMMKEDGSDPLSLTRTFGLAQKDNPVWSPDGTRIAFEFSPKNTGETDIYLMNADGSDKIVLTTNPAYDRNPHWRK